MAADVQHLLTASAIYELHGNILENEYVFEPVYEEIGYWRLLRALEVVFMSTVDCEAFKTVLVMTRRLARNVLGEEEKRVLE
jgi:hypothetical protein